MNINKVTCHSDQCHATVLWKTQAVVHRYKCGLDLMNTEWWFSCKGGRNEAFEKSFHLRRLCVEDWDWRVLCTGTIQHSLWTVDRILTRFWIVLACNTRWCLTDGARCSSILRVGLGPRTSKDQMKQSINNNVMITSTLIKYISLITTPLK